VSWWRDVRQRLELRMFRRLLGDPVAAKILAVVAADGMTLPVHHHWARLPRPQTLAEQLDLDVEAVREPLGALVRAGIVGEVPFPFPKAMGDAAWQWSVYYVTARGMRADRWLKGEA
jgi:hypothetical protein